MNIYPVILSGGSGTRLWPMSREARPKQYLPLLQGRSPFQATLTRLHGIENVRPAIVVANQEHRFLVRDEVKKSGVTPPAIVLEPFGRNTAPATAVVAFSLLRKDPDALLLVLPADHDIADDVSFRSAIAAGAAAAALGNLVVFGVKPRWAETGFGYIERGEALAQAPGSFHVSSFVEKPEIEIAERLVASGHHYWNSGMFLFSAAQFVAELQRIDEELAAACEATAAALQDDHGAQRIDATLFSRCRSISIDYAVMEHTQRAAVVPSSFAWSDIGSWNALWEATEKDDKGNVTLGKADLENVENCLISSDNRLVVGIGLKDMIVIDTPDALLVANRSDAQSVREIVEKLRARKQPECFVHRVVHRPWGHYEDVDSGERFRVKRITVNPGSKLSLQLHHHRTEHWVVVSGTARVTCGETTTLLAEDESTYIPVGMVHRLENPGKIPLQIMEIQSGAYLEEDDIVRLEDVYHRTVPVA